MRRTTRVLVVVSVLASCVDERVADDTRAVPRLAGAVLRTDDPTRARASSDDVDALLEGTHAIEAHALAQLSGETVSRALAVLADARAPRGVRLRALAVVAAGEGPIAAAALDESSRDVDDELRRTARVAIVLRATGEARRARIQALAEDQDPVTRALAVDLFARDGASDRARDALSAMATNDVDEGVRARARRRLDAWASAGRRSDRSGADEPLSSTPRRASAP